MVRKSRETWIDRVERTMDAHKKKLLEQHKEEIAKHTEVFSDDKQEPNVKSELAAIVRMAYENMSEYENELGLYRFEDPDRNRIATSEPEKVASSLYDSIREYLVDYHLDRICREERTGAIDHLETKVKKNIRAKSKRRIEALRKALAGLADGLGDEQEQEDAARMHARDRIDLIGQDLFPGETKVGSLDRLEPCEHRPCDDLRQLRSALFLDPLAAMDALNDMVSYVLKNFADKRGRRPGEELAVLRELMHIYLRELLGNRYTRKTVRCFVSHRDLGFYAVAASVLKFFVEDSYSGQVGCEGESMALDKNIRTAFITYF